MLKVAFNLYLRIIRSMRMYLLIFLNVILSSGYFLVSRVINDEKYAISPKYRYNINAFKDSIEITTFTESYYYITLGFLLWLFILLEIIKYFGTNDSKGILLTHVTNPISRCAYFFSVFTAIFTAFLTISVVNIVISYAVFLFSYQSHGVILFKIMIAALLYATWHILVIMCTTSFIVILFKRTEFAIMISTIIMILASTSIFLKAYLTGVINEYDVPLLHYVIPITMVDGYPYMFFVRHLFTVFDEQSSLEVLSFYTDFGLSINTTIDPDIGKSVFSVAQKNRIIETVVLIGTLIVSLFMLIWGLFTFNKMDIPTKS